MHVYTENTARDVCAHCSSLTNAHALYAPAVPDDMVLKVIELRLNQLDCATKGWVLHGFPLNREQAELLSSVGLQPNRYSCAVERHP